VRWQPEAARAGRAVDVIAKTCLSQSLRASALGDNVSILLILLSALSRTKNDGFRHRIRLYFKAKITQARLEAHAGTCLGRLGSTLHPNALQPRWLRGEAQPLLPVNIMTMHLHSQVFNVFKPEYGFGPLWVQLADT
jgi:hypothetical protein